MEDQTSSIASQDQQISAASNQNDAKDQDTLNLLQSGASEEQDDAEEPVFKSRRKGGAAAKNLRKRKREDETQESETHDVDSEVLKKLEETREYQLLRERKHGYDMSASAVGYSTARKKRDGEVIGRLEETFAVHNEAKPLFDRRMEEYIEQQMRARKERLAQGVDPEEERKQSLSSTASGITSDEQLEAQQALRVPQKMSDVAASLTAGNDKQEDRSRSGPKWATTVVEIELPQKYRMQAIKETEDLLKKMESDSKKPPVPEESPSEYAVNFAKAHQQPVSHNGRATDDLVYEKFKKRFANR